MPGDRTLDAYDLHEEDWDSYEQLHEEFEWVIPEEFNIADYICDRWAETAEDRILGHFEDADGNQSRYTYADFRDGANRLANYLAARGIERGDRVGVDGSQRPAVLIAHIAALKLGAVSVPLSARFGTEGLRYRLDDAGAKAYVTTAGNVETLREVRDGLNDLDTVLVVGDVDPGPGETALEEATADRSPEFENATTGPEDDAMIFYTSGTTGPPKGVLHAHRFLLGHLPLFDGAFCDLELYDDDVVRVPVEWSWMGSLLSTLFPTFYYGLSTVGYRNGQFDPAKEFELIDRYGISIAIYPNTALRMMMGVENAEERYDVSSMRSIPSGGEALDQSAWEWAVEVFGDVINQSYGQTEANVMLGNFPSLRENRPETMGLPAPGHEVRIVDPETAEPTVPTGEVGELAVRYEGDPVCFKEYWNKPEKTDRKVRNGWLLTEDLAWRDEDGYFHFKSRKDDVIISSGYRIGPEEVEDTLGSHEAVADSGVIGVPHEERGEVPKAFVVLADGFDPTDDLKEELQGFVREKLAAYEYPREVEFVEELPRTTTGKLRRKDLREREGVE